jgi:hypothetical protein
MAVAWANEDDPQRIADDIVAAHRGAAGWLDAFAAAFDRGRSAQEFAWVLEVWGLNQSQAATLFGVTRQAVSKWLSAGVPTDRVETVADLAAGTDVLVHYLKRERIPAVVRRSADGLGGRSLLDVVAAGDTRAVLEACRAMFDFAQAHA